MPTLSSDEDVRPASPISASTLLDLESDKMKNIEAAYQFQAGIKRLDANLPQTLWRGGKIIGIASDRGESMLAEHLITTHLSTLAPSVSSDNCNTASTFVIMPVKTSVATNINTILRTKLTTESETARIQLLNTVQLMPYFDFVGLSDSFTEVGSHLRDQQNRTSNESSQVKRNVLLVDGLSPALEATQRRSGLVQANALAASFLRAVTHLSRSFPYLLVIFNLEASWDTRDGEELTLAFPTTGKHLYGVSPGGMLQKTLLAGMDTVVLLHGTVNAGLKKGDLIVEVVKDRTGVGVGHWVVWPRSA